MILFGRVDIWVFFIRKLLWRSSDFSSACMIWKAYQDVPVESQQNVLLWYQWSCAFWDLIIFNQIALCYNKRLKKKNQKIYVILLFVQKKNWNLFRENPPTFLSLPARYYQHSLSPGSACITDRASSEFKLSLQSFSLRCRTALSLHLLLTQLFYRKTWKLFPLEWCIIVCFWGELRFSNSVQL